MRIERKFSFSMSRFLLFESCRRAYYYRYISSWGGWDKAADSTARELYFLKNLISADRFLAEILKNSIKRYIKEKALVKRQVDFFRIAANEFHKYFNLLSENYRNGLRDGKNTTLLELYYDKAEKTEKLKTALLQDFNRIIAIFAKSSFFDEYSEIPYLRFRELSEPENFELGAYSVFLSPLFLRVCNNEAEIVMLYLKDFEHIRYWDISSALAEIFVKKKSKVSSALCRSVFFRNDEMISVWAARTESETEKFVKEKSAELLSFENSTTQTPVSDSKPQCGRCEFRKFCL